MKERGEARKGEGESGDRICKWGDVSGSWTLAAEEGGTREKEGARDDEEPDVVCSSTVESAFLEHTAVSHTVRASAHRQLR